MPPRCLIINSNPFSLYLDSNEISTLVNDSFSGLPELANISLKNNNLRLIESGVFIDCYRLNEVHLENNSLETLDSWPCMHSDFGKAAPLKIYVSNNKLSMFTNPARSPFTPCQSLSQDLERQFFMNVNDIKHIIDIFNGWNLTVTTADELQVLDAF